MRKLYEWLVQPIARAVYKRFPNLYWERRGKSYYATRIIVPWENRAREDIVQRVLAMNPARVLEYGVGDGRLLKSVADGNQRIECHGIDIAATQMVGASKLAPKARLRVCNLTELDYPDNYFDVVYGISVLMYVRPEDRPKAFKELFRVCRGHLIAYELVPKYYDDDTLKRYRKAADFRHEYDYEECMKGAGFEIVEASKDPHSWDDTVLEEGALPFGIIVARKCGDGGAESARETRPA